MDQKKPSSFLISRLKTQISFVKNYTYLPLILTWNDFLQFLSSNSLCRANFSPRVVSDLIVDQPGCHAIVGRLIVIGIKREVGLRANIWLIKSTVWLIRWSNDKISTNLEKIINFRFAKNMKVKGMLMLALNLAMLSQVSNAVYFYA